MKKEKGRRSRSRGRSEKKGDRNVTISPDARPDRPNNDQTGSDHAVNYSPHDHKTQEGATDNRRTQSERRASSRQGRSFGCRPLNPHIRVTRETVILVRKQVKGFTRERLSSRSKFDFPACTKCLEEKILPGWEMPLDGIRDCGDFLQLTLRRETDEYVVTSPEFIDLIGIAKRAREFDNVLSTSLERLQNCLENHTRPHLVSLKHMLPSCVSRNDDLENGDDLLRSVEDHDAMVSQQTQAVEEKLEDLHNAFNSYKGRDSNFADFVRNGDSHTSEMRRWCTDVLEVCKLLENWAQWDQNYPDTLAEELEEKKRQRGNLLSQIRQTQLERSEKKERIRRLLRSEAKAAREYTQYRTIRERLRDRLAELREKDLMLGERIHNRRKELKALKEDKENLGDTSPRRSQEASEEQLERNIENAEQNRTITRKHIKRVEGEIKSANDKTYENKVEMVTFRHTREETEKESRRLDAEIVSLRERVARLDGLCDKLVLVREMKVCPESYRKGLRQLRKQEVSKADGSQDLTNACEHAAPAVGKKWRRLYFYLPFDPPRDVDKRQRDIFVLETIASRRDLTDDEVAKRSLEKWRTFHRHGGVLDLSHALRAINKGTLAKQIENSFHAHA